MSAKDDAQRGLRAKIHAPAEKIQQAISNASKLLGKRSSVEISDGVARVRVADIHLFVGWESPDDGMIELEAVVENFRTRQTTVFFIPVAPKERQSKAHLITYLRALKQELEAIDDGRGTVTLVGPR